MDADHPRSGVLIPRRSTVYSRELAELIFVNPYCRISDLVDSGVAKRQTAATYLKAMVSEGLLEEVKIGRENLYINPALLALLSERGQANI